MLEFITKFISGDGIAKFAAALVIVLTIISGISALLDKIKGLLPDNGGHIIAFINKAASVIQKILDFISANRQHK